LGVALKKLSEKSESFSLLRKKAENFLELNQNKKNDFSKSELNNLIHELEVYQIELELQNEELIAAKEKAEIASTKYSELYQFAPTAYFTLSKIGEILDLNPSGAKLLRADISSFHNSRFGFFVSESTRDVFNNFLDDIFQKKKKNNCEIILNGDSEPPIFAYLEGNLTENGEKCLVNAIDITEQKLISKKLEESEANYKAIFNANKDSVSICFINNDGTLSNIINVNDASIDILGYSRDELSTKKISDIEVNIPEIELKERFNSLLQNQRADFETLVKDKFGNFKNLDVTTVMIEYENKPALMSIVRDITNKKRDEEQLQNLFSELTISKNIIEENLFQKNLLIEELYKSETKLKEALATKDKFFAILAHDLKSPFSGFLGLTDILNKEADILSSKEIQQISKALFDSAKTLYKLIEELLLWSRTQTGNITYIPEQLDLYEVSFNVQFLLKDSADTKKIKLINSIDKETLINGDRNLVSAVFRNLVSNAIKFSHQNGSVEIGICKDSIIAGMEIRAEEICVYIKDYGVGIAEKDLEKLFKISEHHTTRGTSDESGTGLGLILCKEFIEVHRGRIWAESQENIGSTFYFTLQRV